MINLTRVLALHGALGDKEKHAQDLPLMRQECALTALCLKHHRKIQAVLKIYLLVDSVYL